MQNWWAEISYTAAR